jgi:hypothetical protein
MIATVKRPMTGEGKMRRERAAHLRADALFVQKLRGMQASGLRRRIAGDDLQRR